MQKKKSTSTNESLEDFIDTDTPTRKKQLLASQMAKQYSLSAVRNYTREFTGEADKLPISAHLPQVVKLYRFLLLLFWLSHSALSSRLIDMLASTPSRFKGPNPRMWRNTVLRHN